MNVLPTEFNLGAKSLQTNEPARIAAFQMKQPASVGMRQRTDEISEAAVAANGTGALANSRCRVEGDQSLRATQIVQLVAGPAAQSKKWARSKRQSFSRHANS